jgi:hypothetical protein
VTKRILLRSKPEAVGIDEFRASELADARALLATTPRGSLAVSLARTSVEDHTAVGLRPRPSRFHAAWCSWDLALREPEPGPAVAAGAAWLVEEFVAWDHDLTGADGEPTPGVKQLSLVAKRPGIGADEFEAHYRHHVEVARVHQAGICRYVQNVVRAPLGPAGAAMDVFAISELWFATTDDMRDRYYTGPGAKQIVADDVAAFLDPAATTSMITTETILRR